MLVEYMNDEINDYPSCVLQKKDWDWNIHTVVYKIDNW